VRVGVLAERVDNPDGTPSWQWSCGFYPGSNPSEHARGIAETFDQARGAFEGAWRFFLVKHGEADFDAHRCNRAFHAGGRLCGLEASSCRRRLPMARPSASRGAAIGIADMSEHIYAAHMEVGDIQFLAPISAQT
jgi:hypothetical protein